MAVLRKNGDIEKADEDVADEFAASRGDGKVLDGVGYEVVGDASTPHLKHKRHTFVREHD